MKVGLYTPCIDTFSFKGPEKYLLNLAQALSHQPNVELFLIHHRKVEHPDVDAQDIIIKKPMPPPFWELTVEFNHLDVIHFNGIPTTGRICFPMLTCKKVATLHGVADPAFPDYNRLKWRYHRFIQRVMSQFLDSIIAVSKDFKRRLVRYVRIPERKIKVVYEGVSPVYRPVENASYIKEKYNLSQPFILHVSNFAPKKNPKIVLKSFSELRKKGFKLKLVITGARWNNRYVETMIEKLNLVQDVRILGYVPEVDLICLYNLAELLVFPSLEESFGFPVIEAMACGTPVVTSNVYSMPEVSGNAAILCSPHDYHEFANAMQRVLKDSDLREKMIRMGLKNAKKFTWERCATETTKIYRQIVDRE